MKVCSNCKKEIENVNGEYCIFCGEKLIEIKEENEKNKEETKTEKEQINGKKPKKIRKYYEIRLNNLSDDIFPFERNPTIKFIYYNSNIN